MNNRRLYLTARGKVVYCAATDAAIRSYTIIPCTIHYIGVHATLRQDLKS